MDQIRWAWLAGILEGEGCFTFGSNRQPKIVVVMSDEDIIRRAHAWSGVGVVYGPRVPKTGHNIKPLWYWHVSARAEVALVIEQVLPLLGARRAKRAGELLVEAQRASRHNKDKTHCKYGHPLRGMNVYIWKGRRCCMTCRAEAAQRLRDRRRSA